MTRWQRVKLRWYRARNRAATAARATGRFVSHRWWLSAVGLGFISWGSWIGFHPGPIAIGVSFLAMELRLDMDS